MAEVDHYNYDEEEALRKIDRSCRKLASFVVRHSPASEHRHQSYANIGVDIKKGVGIFLRLSSVSQGKKKAAEVSVVEYPQLDEENIRHSYTVDGDSLTSISPKALTKDFTDIAWPTVFEAPQLQDCLNEFTQPDVYEANIDPGSLQKEIDAIYEKGTPHLSFEFAKLSVRGLDVIVARRVHTMPQELAGLLAVDTPVIDECKMNVVMDGRVIGKTKTVHGRKGLVLETVDSDARAIAKFYGDNLETFEKGALLH